MTPSVKHHGQTIRNHYFEDSPKCSGCGYDRDQDRPTYNRDCPNPLYGQVELLRIGSREQYAQYKELEDRLATVERVISYGIRK